MACLAGLSVSPLSACHPGQTGPGAGAQGERTAADVRSAPEPLRGLRVGRMGEWRARSPGPVCAQATGWAEGSGGQTSELLVLSRAGQVPRRRGQVHPRQDTAQVGSTAGPVGRTGHPGGEQQGCPSGGADGDHRWGCGGGRRWVRPRAEPPLSLLRGAGSHGSTGGLLAPAARPGPSGASVLWSS